LGLTRNSLAIVAAGLLIGAGLGVLIILGVRLGGPFLAKINPPSEVGPLAPEIDIPAPDFELADLSGKPVRLSDLRGHPVVVNFWATWCGPCRLEMPLLQKYADRYPQDLHILAVNDGETQDEVQKFVDDLGLQFNILLDPAEKVIDLYRVQAFPSTFFLDASGNIRFQHIGTLNEDQLVGYLDKLGVSQ
jgi:thiol-disulfide isomerase/thioredoxin